MLDSLMPHFILMQRSIDRQLRRIRLEEFLSSVENALSGKSSDTYTFILLKFILMLGDENVDEDMEDIPGARGERSVSPEAGDRDDATSWTTFNSSDFAILDSTRDNSPEPSRDVSNKEAARNDSIDDGPTQNLGSLPVITTIEEYEERNDIGDANPSSDPTGAGIPYILLNYS